MLRPDVEEVLSFSPIFREKLRKAETDTDELASQLKRTAKQAKDVAKISKSMIEERKKEIKRERERQTEKERERRKKKETTTSSPFHSIFLIK
jgi:hypothetical protein